jgi:hypothetical protein
MPKPKSRNNREKAVERPLIVVESELVPRKKRQDTEGVSTDGKPAILIVCEGETEAAYFESLYAFFDLKVKFEIKILPSKSTKKDNDSEDKPDEDGYKGSSVKGLLYTAMKEQKKALLLYKLLYNEIWIVTDNDEGNAYKLDNNSLERIKASVPEHIYDTLKAYQIVEMNVREEEKSKGEHLRKRYFLCYSDYELFLREHILAPKDLMYLDTIISKTSKGHDFTNLYDSDRRAFFYNDDGFISEKNKDGVEKFNKKYFDEKCLNSIKIAYSSFSFEHWLLLHFEENNTPFYNSRAIIKYFDDNEYFERNFEKGWYLYGQRENGKVLKDFFSTAIQAINNNMWLNTIMQPQINAGKSFYEVNPYTDVFCLVNLLLNRQHTIIGYVNIPIMHYGLNDIVVSRNAHVISIKFTFGRTESALKRNIEPLFSIKDANNNLIDIELRTIVDTDDQVIRTGSKVDIDITFSKNQDFPLFLYLKHQNKDEEHVLIWAIL